MAGRDPEQRPEGGAPPRDSSGGAAKSAPEPGSHPSLLEGDDDATRVDPDPQPPVEPRPPPRRTPKQTLVGMPTPGGTKPGMALPPAIGPGGTKPAIALPPAPAPPAPSALKPRFGGGGTKPGIPLPPVIRPPADAPVPARPAPPATGRAAKPTPPAKPSRREAPPLPAGIASDLPPKPAPAAPEPSASEPESVDLAAAVDVAIGDAANDPSADRPGIDEALVSSEAAGAAPPATVEATVPEPPVVTKRRRDERATVRLPHMKKKTQSQPPPPPPSSSTSSAADMTPAPAPVPTNDPSAGESMSPPSVARRKRAPADVDLFAPGSESDPPPPLEGEPTVMGPPPEPDEPAAVSGTSATDPAPASARAATPAIPKAPRLPAEHGDPTDVVETIPREDEPAFVQSRIPLPPETEPLFAHVPPEALSPRRRGPAPAKSRRGPIVVGALATLAVAGGVAAWYFTLPPTQPQSATVGSAPTQQPATADGEDDGTDREDAEQGAAAEADREAGSDATDATGPATADPYAIQDRPVPSKIAQLPPRVKRQRLAGLVKQARRMHRRERYDRAADLWERAWQYDQRNATVAAGMAQALLEQQQGRAAAGWAQRAAALAPRDEDVQTLLGDAYVAANDHRRAREAYQRVLELDPRNRVVRRKMARLRRR